MRNTFRRRLRLSLTLGLLAAGGAMLLSGLNVAAAWDQTITTSLADHRYNPEVRLNPSNSQVALAERIRAIPGVQQVEVWGSAPISLAQPSGINVAHTYPDGGHGSFTLLAWQLWGVRGHHGDPDGGHGSFTLLAPPAETTLVQFPVLAGRWLRPGDTNAVVFNQMVRAFLPGVKAGDTISLSIAGRVTTWHVLGIVQEVGSQAIAYVNRDAFARLNTQSEQASSFV